MFLELTGFPLILVSILAFVVILGSIVCLHEAGHFFVAKKCGILCYEFSIGMGPAIFKKQYGETSLVLRALPLGGYVAMASAESMDDFTKLGSTIGVNLTDDVVTEIVLDEQVACAMRGTVTDKDLDGKEGKDLYLTLTNDMGVHYYKVSPDAMYLFEKAETLQLAPYERQFDSKPVWKRFLTLLAGPMMNFVLAMVLYIIIAFATGVPNLSSNTVGEVGEQYPAAVCLTAGDQIVSINDMEVNSWTEFQNALNVVYSDYGTELTIGYVHNGERKKETIHCYTEIVSIGLTNYLAPSYVMSKIPGTEESGLVVGKVGLRYKDEKNKGTLSEGDYITKISVDGKVEEIESWGQLAEIFNTMDVKTSVDIRFEYYHKDGDTYTKVGLDECKSIEPYTDEVLQNQRINKVNRYIGVTPEYHFSFFGCLGLAGQSFWKDFTLVFRTLKLLIAPSSVRQVGIGELSSVVGIFDIIKSYVGAGLLALMSLAAMLSVNVGIMNLLPIPALDGGRMLFLLYEAVTRKKPSKKVENTITLIFMGLLLLLFVFVTYNDILRLIRK